MVPSVGRWEEVRGQCGAAQALSSQQLNPGSRSCHHRAQGSGARAASVGSACWEGEPRAWGLVLSSRPCAGSGLSTERGPLSAQGLRTGRTAPGCHPSPAPHTPPSHPPHPFSPSAVYKALSQCDLICGSPAPRGREGRGWGGGAGRAAFPGLLLGHCTLKPAFPICLSLPANGEFPGGSS